MSKRGSVDADIILYLVWKEWGRNDGDSYAVTVGAGARAFCLAIDVVMQGIKISNFAEEHEALETALPKWGTGKTGFKM